MPDPNNAKDLLLEDLRSLSDSLWKNEQTGETRVNWFIGIVAAAAGGLFGLSGAEHGPHGAQLRLMVIGSLLALLAFGIVTLLRIIKRNAVTDGFKKDFAAIREIFRDKLGGDQILLDYHPFRKKEEKNLARKAGGLTDIVVTINSLLVAGIAVAVVYPFNATAFGGLLDDQALGWTYGAGIVGFGAAFAVQFMLVRRADHQTRAKLREDPVTHAGGIVYRINDHKVLYLLVGPSDKTPNKWLFPKGKIKQDEEQWEAAVREVREEAGVRARPICPIGKNAFEVNGKLVVVKYYLMECFDEIPRTDPREKHWFEFEKARDSLTHDDNKKLLSAADQRRIAAGQS